MREIKFRAYNKFTNEMDFHPTLNNQHTWPPGRTKGVVRDYAGCAGFVSLMQFTGLKDKNGMEIYEGDILFHDYGDGDPATFEVRYCAENAAYRLYWSRTLKGSAEMFPAALIRLKTKIIGNIYQNPELLK